MQHFPVSNSNLSASHLAAFVQEQYMLKGTVDCMLLRAGINDTYVIRSGSGKFIFRVYSLNWRTKTEIMEEIRLLTRLKEQQLPISYAVADRHSGFIQTLNAPEGERFGVLFSYAPGEKLHSFSPEAHFRIGEIMARLHTVTENIQLERATYTPDLLLVDSLKKISAFLSDDSEEMKFMKSAQLCLLNEFLKINKAEVRTGAVHLDIWFENLNISKENEITVFDFDFCGNGILALDLAFYMMQTYNLERDDAQCRLKLESFFKGYESISKLSPEEKRILPMLGVSIYFFYLGVQCQRFDNWSNSFLSESYLKRFINGLVKRYFEIHKLDAILIQ